MYFQLNQKAVNPIRFKFLNGYNNIRGDLVRVMEFA